MLRKFERFAKNIYVMYIVRGENCKRAKNVLTFSKQHVYLGQWKRFERFVLLFVGIAATKRNSICGNRMCQQFKPCFAIFG